jgi:hypothetical protein
MRDAILILPGHNGELPAGKDFTRAGFTVSQAVAMTRETGDGPKADQENDRAAPRPGQDAEPARTEKGYCTSSKPARASSTLMPS